MKLTWSAVVTGFAAMSAVNAHFQVNFPAVRGDFNEDNETQFCGQSLVPERPLLIRVEVDRRLGGWQAGTPNPPTGLDFLSRVDSSSGKLSTPSHGPVSHPAHLRR